MKILHRFIIRQFLINFAILLFVLGALFVVVDLIVDSDEFINAGKYWAEQWQMNQLSATLWVLLDYHGPMLLLIYSFFSGLLVVGAAGFTLVGLSRSRELTAIVTSGVSLHRISLPIFIVGVLLNALVVVEQEYILPPLAEKLVRSKSDLKSERGSRFAVRYAVDGHGNLISAGAFDPQQEMLENVTILIRNESGEAVRRISASQAWWRPDRGGYELLGGSGVARQQPADEDFATGPEGAEFFGTDLSPEVLLARRAALFKRLMSVQELYQLQDRRSMDRDEVRKIIQGRASMVVLNVAVLIAGLSFFLMREPTNYLRRAVVASATCIGMWGGGLLTILVPGSPELPGGIVLNPATSAWLPVIIAVPIAVWMFSRVKT